MPGNLVSMTNSDATTATITIRELDEDDPAVLYCHYKGEFEVQSCHIALDLEDGEVVAEYDGQIGPGIPASVYHGRTRWYDIPCLTAKAANLLMEEVAPLVERVYVGSEIEWDGNNHVGVLNEDAKDAEQEIEIRLGELNENPWDYEVVIEAEAYDWFTTGDMPPVLNADTTDEELDEIVAENEREASDCDSRGYTVLTGTKQFLIERREEMRQAVREEMEQVADEVTERLQQRDTLIRRVSKFGDSTRDIAELVGLSHTGVGKIVKRETGAEDEAAS